MRDTTIQSLSMSISMYSKPLLPGEFRASSRPVVSKVPGAPFSGPVARGFEILCCADASYLGVLGEICL